MLIDADLNREEGDCNFREKCLETEELYCFWGIHCPLSVAGLMLNCTIL